MGVLSNRVERSELVEGDHIYSWRTLFAYSHHGIYVGGSKVVHFTQQNIVSGESSINVVAMNVSSACTIRDCGFQQKESGVILSCLDCFLDGGRLYRFEYGVTNLSFLSRIRGGTCTTAQSDPPDEVIHRAIYLLQNGFGSYNTITNNCEDFALYCKTGLVNQEVGSSGQANSAIFGTLTAIVSLPLKLFMSTPAGSVLFQQPLKLFMSTPAGSVLSVGMYSLSRYATDIGVVMSDGTKVKVEKLTSLRNQKSAKKSINKNHSDSGKSNLNQTNTPAK